MRYKRAMNRELLTLWMLTGFMICSLYLLSKEASQLEKGRPTRAVPKNAVKKILYWNSFFEYDDYVFGFGRTPFVENNCPVDSCHVTNRRGEGPWVEDFDAIIFHAWSIGWVTKRALARRQPHQRYVFFLMEPPGVYRSRLDHLQDFFNWTMTYRLDSDIYRPYSYFAPVNDTRTHLDINDRNDPVWRLSGNETTVSFPPGKTRLVAWFVSNCRTQSQREIYVEELSRHIKVDIFGKCGSLDCLTRGARECYQMLHEKYKFYLSFESSLCKDYLTEKIFSPMHYHVVPIVYGGADYERVVPPGSYIDTRDFASPKELADYLKFLDANPAVYAKFFRWKESYTIKQDAMALAMCRLCSMLNDPTLPPKTYTDIHQWYEGPDVCHDPSSHWSARYRRNKTSIILT